MIERAIGNLADTMFVAVLFAVQREIGLVAATSDGTQLLPFFGVLFREIAVRARDIEVLLDEAGAPQNFHGITRVRRDEELTVVDVRDSGIVSRIHRSTKVFANDLGHVQGPDAVPLQGPDDTGSLKDFNTSSLLEFL